jgi:hypothetical protein
MKVSSKTSTHMRIQPVIAPDVADTVAVSLEAKPKQGSSVRLAPTAHWSPVIIRTRSKLTQL